MKALQMQSCVHENATVECALVEIAIPIPSQMRWWWRLRQAPINPSDLGLMFGAADLSSVREVERNGQPALLLDVPSCGHEGNGAARRSLDGRSVMKGVGV
jgi:NADPH2:quinone reductase